MKDYKNKHSLHAESTARRTLWVLTICLEGYAVTGITSQEIEAGRTTAGTETGKSGSIGTETRSGSLSTGMMRTDAIEATMIRTESLGTGTRSGSSSTGMMRTESLGTGTRSDAIEATRMTMKGGVIEITRMSIVGTGTMTTMMTMIELLSEGYRQKVGK